MRLDHKGRPGIEAAWSISSADFLRRGQPAWKWAAVEKIGFYVEHIMTNTQYSPEWIAVDGSAYSHSEFNLSTLKAHLGKPPFANLLWLSSGLLC